MQNLGTNQILLLSCLAVLIGIGTYVTYFRQQSTLSSLEQEIEATQEERRKIDSLQTTLSAAESKFETVRLEWESQYKTIPETTTSPAVVNYLTELTETGFQRFDVNLEGTEERDGYSVYAFTAEGEAFFTSLYRFIWTAENNRPFYRIRDLSLEYMEERTTDEETGRTSMDVLVSFQMEVEAIYGVTDPMGEPATRIDERERDRLPVAQRSPAPPLPSEVLPNPSPEINPFYPLVFEEVPPNEENRLNVESAQLISIVGEEAIFETGDGIERVAEGDRVYLGRIIEVDVSEGRVVAQLNKGGIIETVERTLQNRSPLELREDDEG